MSSSIYNINLLSEVFDHFENKLVKQNINAPFISFIIKAINGDFAVRLGKL
jgi:hypothetical protein